MPYLPYIPFLSALPSPSGPHAPIGYATVVSPALVPYARASPTINGAAALRLGEVGYAVYYPAERGGSVGWVPEPRAAVVAGYEKFLGKRAAGWMFMVLRTAAGFVKFSAAVNAPLRPSPTRYPLVVFSHGLAGTRNTYSQFCSSIAAEGYVVLAVEHHDGSAPSVLVSNEDGSRTSMQYTPPAEVEWAKGTHTSEDFRALQLDFRVREVYEAHASFKRLLRADPDLVVDGLAGEKKATWAASFGDHVDTNQVYLAGHSFGGGTMLHLLQTSPPAKEYKPLPVKRAIALDPWLEPLPLPAASTQASAAFPPVLVVNAQGFTEWTTHFQRLLKLVSSARGSLCTIIGMGHQDFSDFPLLWPPKASNGFALHKTVHQLSAAFFRGSLGDTQAIQGKAQDNGQFQREGGKMKGELGDVVAHLLGEDA
ncbi:hypothetical protein Q5752_002987 [Cryptotrichosporon argae]